MCLVSVVGMLCWLLWWLVVWFDFYWFCRFVLAILCCPYFGSGLCVTFLVVRLSYGVVVCCFVTVINSVGSFASW